MALKQSVTAFSTEFKDAYHEVSELYYRKDSGDEPNTQYVVVTYASEKSRKTDGDTPFFKETHAMNLDMSKTSQNPVAKAYGHLKNQEKYKEAEDV